MKHPFLLAVDSYNICDTVIEFCSSHFGIFSNVFLLCRHCVSFCILLAQNLRLHRLYKAKVMVNSYFAEESDGGRCFVFYVVVFERCLSFSVMPSFIIILNCCRLHAVVCLFYFFFRKRHCYIFLYYLDIVVVFKNECRLPKFHPVTRVN